MLVTGEKGVGKTALLREALRIILARPGDNDCRNRMPAPPAGRSGVPGIVRWDHAIVVLHVNPLGECLKEIARQLWDGGRLALPVHLQGEKEWESVRKWYAQQGAVGRQNIICESLQAARPAELVCFDSLDRISTTHQPFLENVLMAALVCAAVVRVRDLYHFKKIWSSFSIIELRPLCHEAARELTRQLVRRHGICVGDSVLYEREVVKSSDGNPFHVRNLVWQSSCEGALGVEEIRSLRNIEEGEYFNMGPVYIFGASIFTLFKIFSLGMDNREFYIYFSALGFLVYLTFRVFRNFFLFRPQKYGR